MAMNLHENQALKYLDDNGYDISRAELYRLKNEIKESSQERLNLIASKEFLLGHLERIDTLRTILKEMWVNYHLEIPKSKTERKKLIDEIIGDNIPEDILYYFNNEDEPMGRSDSTFSYDDFVNYSIDELRSMSFKGGGSKAPGIWRDNDGKLRDKFGQLVSNAQTGQGGYQ
jgi:hypothetical protein